jgi:hypothetical protein
MADAKTVRGTKLLIKVSDGASSPTFAHPCLINTDRGISFNADTNDVVIPDCSNPDLMAWAAREKVTLSAEITGAGTLNTPDTSDYFDWVTSADPKAVRVELGDVALADGGGYWSGNFHLTRFEVNGTRGNRAQCAITMQSDGSVTWTDAAS